MKIQKGDLDLESKFEIGAVITTINSPSDMMEKLVNQSLEAMAPFVVIGDSKSIFDWSDIGADYYSIESQMRLDFNLIGTLKKNHYARKNIGYLLLFQRKCEWIYETDDDNFPLNSPFKRRKLKFNSNEYSSDVPWVNTYDIFLQSQEINHPIWPRGFSLQDISKAIEYELKTVEGTFSIQQGLANLDPDVDAIYRLLFKNKIVFDLIEPITIGNLNWAPINSQSTWWHESVQRLMYLPSTCSFRLTDILRGYIALRILRSIGHKISFHSPVVYQVRNEHNLIEDFESEIKLYTHSQSIQIALDGLNLVGLNLSEKLINCYEVLIDIGVVAEEELEILKNWCLDCDLMSVGK